MALFSFNGAFPPPSEIHRVCGQIITALVGSHIEVLELAFDTGSDVVCSVVTADGTGGWDLLIKAGSSHVSIYSCKKIKY